MSKQKAWAKQAKEALDLVPKLEAESAALKKERNQLITRAKDAERELSDLKLAIEKAKQARARADREQKNKSWWHRLVG